MKAKPQPSQRPVSATSVTRGEIKSNQAQFRARSVAAGKGQAQVYQLKSYHIGYQILRWLKRSLGGRKVEQEIILLDLKNIFQ